MRTEGAHADVLGGPQETYSGPSRSSGKTPTGLSQVGGVEARVFPDYFPPSCTSRVSRASSFRRSEGRRDSGIVADHVRAVRRVHLAGIAGTEARVVDRAVTGDDLLRRIDLNHLVVELIADQRVAVGQAHRARRERRRIAARAGVGEVIPDH